MNAKTTDFSGFDYVSGIHLSMRSADPKYGHRHGIFWSRHGIVDIYSQAPVTVDGRTWDGLTSMTIVVAGRTFHRSWKAFYGDKTIAKLAREFADYAASAMSTGTAKTPKAVEGQSPASAVPQGMCPRCNTTHLISAAAQ